MQDQTKTVSPLEAIGDALHTPMIDVNGVILDRMASDIPMIPELAGYLIAAGGKRIRPLLTLACASLCKDEAPSDNAKKLAAAVEFIHTATLLHDDVVDDSTERRNKPTANAVFGNKESILVGDFLFARAFELMVETGHINALESLARASAIITEGEVLQMSLIGKTDITRAQYFKVIEAKTAALFAAACEVAPILAGLDPKPFAAYGHHLGMVFQITDDIMDYTSPKMGKRRGDDFLEGKITLPYLIALETTTEGDKAFLESAIATPSEDHLDQVLTILKSCTAFEQSYDIAQTHADEAAKALRFLPSTALSDNLIALPHTLVHRMR